MRRRSAEAVNSQSERLRANTWARYVERPYGWQYNEVLAWVRLLWDGPGPVFKGYLCDDGQLILPVGGHITPG
ncbi:MAG TPA: hypothetical protein VK988_18875 [Acidimicrobiales bacterium]|nr:hypothetical protein [Acidimicrobiales bacterium]